MECPGIADGLHEPATVDPVSDDRVDGTRVEALQAIEFRKERFVTFADPSITRLCEIVSAQPLQRPAEIARLDAFRQQFTEQAVDRVRSGRSAIPSAGPETGAAEFPCRDPGDEQPTGKMTYRPCSDVEPFAQFGQERQGRRKPTRKPSANGLFEQGVALVRVRDPQV